jgi:DNA-binding NtrC family response regulator
MRAGSDGGAGGPGLAGAEILIIEDEALIALDLERALREAGCETALAASVAEALACLDRGRPHAALLDVSLSDGRATRLAEAMRSLGVPFAVASGYEGYELDEPALRGVPRLSKPYSHGEVERVLLELLGR